MDVHQDIGNEEGETMDIGPISHNKVIANETQRQKGNEQQAVEAEVRSDTVEISLEARRKLAALADEQLTRLSIDEELTGEKSALPEKLIQARQRIGFYDRPEVTEKIAEKLVNEIMEEPNETDKYSE